MSAASPHDAEAYIGLGNALEKKRQWQAGLDAYKKAGELDARLAEPSRGIGSMLLRLNQPDEAEVAFRKATDIDRKFPEAQLAYGDCLVQTQQHAKAVDALTRGLNWGPKWKPKFMVALGDVELARDSLRDAGIWYTRAREESPEDPTPRRALGDFYVRRGTFDLAVPEYQSAIEKDSSDVVLRFKLGQALFYAQRYNEALEVYKDVTARDPEFAPGQLALGDLYYRSGAADPRRYADARPYLEKYTQMMPNDPKGWSTLGRTLVHLGARDEALTALNKAEALGDKSKDMYRARFRLMIDRKEYEKAIADYERSDPEPDDQLRMAQVLVFMKQPAKAESLYVAMVKDTAAGSNRNAKFALNALGKLRFREKDYPGAVGYFEKRIALDPGNDEAYYYIGLSYKEMKEYSKALDALRESARLAESKADRQFWYGILLAQVDSVAAAKTVLSRAVTLDTTGTSKNTGVAQRQLGFYDLLAKDYSSAIQKLEKSVQISDKDVQAWVWLAQAYQNSGNRTKACEAYKRALAIDPQQPDALKGVKSLGC